MDASLSAAEHDNADGSIAGALQASYQPLRNMLGMFLDGVSTGADSSVLAGTLITGLAGFDQRATGELHRLLRERVAALLWTRRMHVAVRSRSPWK